MSIYKPFLGHVKSQTKFGPDRKSVVTFIGYKQTNTSQTSKVYLEIYILTLVVMLKLSEHLNQLSTY